ncbi:MAG: LemA family protein, partial [Polaribacter sp.]
NNQAVILQEDAKTTWSNVESAYQRRNDLIGNLVKTVKGAADFEKETLTQVIQARAKATSTTINAGNLTPENMAQFQKAQAGLSGALSKLLVSVERYPDLKANKNFLELQSQLEGTENRINVARDRFNEGVNKYNKHIKVFPNSFLAGIFNFDEMTRYKANPGSENAPDVNFDFKNKKE